MLVYLILGALGLIALVVLSGVRVVRPTGRGLVERLGKYHRFAKVVHTALQNAVSVASLMLTTECLVAQSPPPEGEGAGAGSHGRMDM